MAEPGSIAIHQLKANDRFRLESESSGDDVRFEDKEVDPNEHAEFLTATAVVVLTITGIKAVSAWLSKKRSGETLSYHVTVRQPDGTEKQTELVWTRKESELPDAEQLNALAKMLSVDLSRLPA
jgi:hypothetical protein